ncbi:MAG: PEP-CTERM sorting domain-containing protein [Planctomycetota bacterium]
MQTHRYALLLATAGLFAAQAHAHNHATIDTQSNTIHVRAGYLASESSFIIDSTRRLLHNGQPATYVLPDIQVGGDFDGWYTQDINLLTLTSDFFYTTGRLGNGYDSNDFIYNEPGNFLFEIIEVTPVGGSPDADFAHVLGASTSGGVSSAIDQAGRSFHVGIGQHDHGQRLFIEHAGTYDIRYRAWDSTGQFDTDISPAAASDLVVRVTVPEPGVLTLALPGLAAIMMRRRRA